MTNRRYWVETSRYAGGYLWRIVSATAADEAFGVATIEKTGKTFATEEIAKAVGDKHFKEFMQ